MTKVNVEYSSCGYSELLDGKRVNFCPKCGSEEIRVIRVGEAISQESVSRASWSEKGTIERKKKRLKFYLYVSVAFSLFCGVVAALMFSQSRAPVEMWVVIPIAMGIGFFVPLIALVLKKVEDAVDKVKKKLGPLDQF